MILFSLIFSILSPISSPAAVPFTCFSIPSYQPEYKQDPKTKLWCLQKHSGWVCKAVTGWWGTYKVASCHNSHPNKAVAIKAVMGACAQRKMDCDSSNIECQQVSNSPYCQAQDPYDPDYLAEQEEAKRRALDQLERHQREEQLRKFEEWCRQYPDQCNRL